MCNGQTANNTINTCNGNDCAGFIEGHGQNGLVMLTQPAVWTENEEWFDDWSGDKDGNSGTKRSADDQAFAVARWYARGGCVMNYYMYHGGNHYSHWAGGGVATMYANNANLHSDGLPNEPKYSHLTKLHNIIRDIAHELVTRPAQYNYSIALPYYDSRSGQWLIGTAQKAFVYGPIVFIESYSTIPLFVRDMNNITYWMPPNNLLVFNNGKLIFNTSNIAPSTQVRVYQPVPMSFQWTMYSEPIFCPATDCPTESITQHAAVAGMPVFQSSAPLDQLNLTRDLTDNMWYEVVFTLTDAISAAQLNFTGATANAYVVFLDGTLIGDISDPTHAAFTDPSPQSILLGDVSAGRHRLNVFSVCLGIENWMAPDSIPYRDHFKGIASQVTIGTTVIVGTWTQRPYSLGEYLAIYTDAGANNVEWSRTVRSSPVSWYRSTFGSIAAANTSEVVLNIGTKRGLGRGHIYINGNDIGRYWSIIGTTPGMPTQQYYHVPSDWIRTENTITIFEEVGVQNINEISFAIAQMEPATELKREQSKTHVLAE